ncbi:hypothetical protein AAFF_G00131710 [Aldrovandia affinis]|uniref:Uncharacterized protein n=1 Tax=Aldrovandia affinis TaxID=143900 RepID=A0AAD7RQJ1_9TELE|nr:hypothetical protein AAFF_G00131710 [Aldrovandia affinis]
MQEEERSDRVAPAAVQLLPPLQSHGDSLRCDHTGMPEHPCAELWCWRALCAAVYKTTNTLPTGEGAATFLAVLLRPQTGEPLSPGAHLEQRPNIKLEHSLTVTQITGFGAAGQTRRCMRWTAADLRRAAAVVPADSTL